MTETLPRVYTIAAGEAFLDILAENILLRFPTFETQRPLTEWTVLVPTRRAANELVKSFKRQSKGQTLLLPRISPIGDVDEFFIDTTSEIFEKPTPVSPQAQLLLLLGLVETWARDNPQIGLAGEITRSAVQRLGLAKSLQELIITVETNECTFEKLSLAYDTELSIHREAILSLLQLLHDQLPSIHHAQGQISTIAYRNRMIRLNAARIASGEHQGPIIAAGSTGTIPSTRALLKAIACHPEGAVILPGLNTIADDAYWALLPQEHPQYSMKLFLQELELNHKHIAHLGVKNGSSTAPRDFLISEVMRPSETTHMWHSVLAAKHDCVKKASHGISEISAPDRQLEARSIAVIMRKTLEVEHETAALITPDRDLAIRVKAELRRWNIDITDTASLALNTKGQGHILDLLLECALQNFGIASVMALLGHNDVTLGFAHDGFVLVRQQFEFACLRGNPFMQLSPTFKDLAQTAHQRSLKTYRNHPLVKSLQPEDWAAIEALCVKLDEALAGFTDKAIAPFSTHIARLVAALEILNPDYEKATTEQRVFEQFIAELNSAAHFHPSCSLYEAALVIQQLLRTTPLPPSFRGHPRLGIYGTLEARLMKADVVILGGLNEAIWPKQTDPGPWLNRAMRDLFGLPHPERDIGLAAHDFEQGFGNARVYLTSSGRIGGSPTTPSRWLLRLKTVLDAAQVSLKADPNFDPLQLAQTLDEAGKMQAHGKPKFAPPLAARPIRFSVTEIEKLIRNPYAIYAKRILMLEPLEDFGKDQDAALLGSVFHDALALWNTSEAQNLDTLLAAGQEVFTAYAITKDTKRFWWPRFLRTAGWIVEQEKVFAKTTIKNFAEINGSHKFKINDTEFELRARADRIDVLNDNSVRIIDYKTGTPPSPKQVETFLAPQLTLEAALIINNGFKGIQPSIVSEILYLHLGGGKKGLNVCAITPKDSLDDLAKEHFGHLQSLLKEYLDPTLEYLPRVRVKTEAEEAEFDHLSRYLEWTLAGDA